MKKITILFIALTIIPQIASWKEFEATVSFSVNSDSTEQRETFSWDVPFRIDKKSIRYGYSTTVKLFNMVLDNDNSCNIVQTGSIPDWFAAYVTVPDKCSRSGYVKQLVSLGADFIFLNGKGSEEDFVLSSNGLNVPVFLVNNTLSDFSSKVEARLEYNYEEPESLYGDSIQLQINMPNPPSVAGTAKIDFFYSPANELAYNYTTQFVDVYNLIGDHFAFNPIIFLFSLPINDAENCISNGLYCALDPDGEVGPLNGKMVIEESLRQRCIYNLSPKAWVDYMYFYQQDCFKSFKYTCFKATLTKTGLSSSKVDECVKDSFKSESADGRTHNTLLDQDLMTISNEQPDHSPALYINGAVYSGMAKSKYIANAICMTLETKPQACLEIETILSIPDAEGYYETMVYVYSAFLILIVTAMACLVFQRWKYSRIMDEEVRKKIDKYYQLQGGEVGN